MNRITYISILTLFLSTYINSSAQTPTYDLTMRNFVLSDSFPHDDNILEFDICLQCTGTTPLEYAGGQYYIYFNPDIANGGNLTFQILNSDLPVNLRPINPSINSDEGIPVVLKLGLNAFPGPGNGYIINQIFPGTRIARVRLKTSAFSFKKRDAHLADEMYLNSKWLDEQSISMSTKIYSYVNSQITNITTPETHLLSYDMVDFCGTVLQLRLLEEGLYNETMDQLNRKDSIKIYIRDRNFPYTLRDSAKGAIDTTDLFGTFYLKNIQSGIYYIVVNDPNSIETWGLDTLERNICNTPSRNFHNAFNFSTSAAQAYGNNLKLKGTRYCIYSGDVNKSGMIDVTDIVLIYNDAINFLTGIVNTDLNGDNFVDVEDIFIAKANSDNFVSAITPLNP